MSCLPISPKCLQPLKASQTTLLALPRQQNLPLVSELGSKLSALSFALLPEAELCRQGDQQSALISELRNHIQLYRSAKLYLVTSHSPLYKGHHDYRRKSTQQWIINDCYHLLSQVLKYVGPENTPKKSTLCEASSGYSRSHNWLETTTKVNVKF